jgi:hypothetical protein
MVCGTARSCNICNILISFQSTVKTSSFANISVAPKSKAPVSELDAYLKLDVEDVADPLEWWNKGKGSFPQLHRMALDFLSIPGTIPSRTATINSNRHFISNVYCR